MMRIACLVSFVLSIFGMPPALAQSPRRSPGDDQLLVTSLQVQTVLRRARQKLAQRQFAAAVDELERHLSQANGDGVYLSLLEQAYRGYIAELERSGSTALAAKYRRRLAILAPALSPAGAKPPRPETPATAKPKSKADLVKPKSSLVVRANDSGEETDSPEQSPVDELLQRADDQFRQHHFAEAARLYQEAAKVRSPLPQATRERWAYCKLHWVTEQLNSHSPQNLDFSRLRIEVRQAMDLAPRLDLGRKVLQGVADREKAVRNRRSDAPANPSRAGGQGSWQTLESDHFRVYHRDASLAEQVIRIAEKTRSAVYWKWFGENNPSSWPAPCEIYLHPDREAYARATGVTPQSPGHSSIGSDPNDAGRILSRRIDLHVDEANLLRAVLPHEVTHVVIAGKFGPRPIPRWVDEGMAVLSEPYDRIQRHLDGLPQRIQGGQALTVDQLLALEDYPAPSQMSAFYGQSVTLVQYLTELRGPRTFTAFVRDSLKEGYAAALARHYDIGSLEQLAERWRTYVVIDGVPSLTRANTGSR